MWIYGGLALRAAAAQKARPMARTTLACVMKAASIESSKGSQRSAERAQRATGRNAQTSSVDEARARPEPKYNYNFS